MGVVSWLAARFELVDKFQLTLVQHELQEERKSNLRFRRELEEVRKELAETVSAREILTEQVVERSLENDKLQERAALEHELAAEAQVRSRVLESEVEYLRGQVKIYQQRLGLLPQERQSQTEPTEHKPLRTAREPFAQMAHRVQLQRTEEYWKQRAAAANEGTTGATSEVTPTVSETD